MIFGIGTDIVQVSRIQRNLDRYGDRFARRILADSEYQEYLCSRHPARFVAKRFAVKESVAKAFGTGFTDGLNFREIAVRHGKAGNPLLHLTGRAAELSSKLGIDRDFVSIADEKEYAVAFVTLTVSGS
jgi:holo-[acyl-carrier protein] synthase